MDPATATLVAGGIAAAANGGNMYAQAKTNKKSREFAKEMYDLQRGDNISDWNLQNAYNHPAAQMERLKAAGLNPALMYGGGPGNMSAGSVSSATPKVSYATPPQLDLGAIQNSGMNMLQAARFERENDLVKADIELKRNQSIKTLTEAEAVAIDNKTRDEINNRRSTLMHYQAEAQYENANLTFTRNEAAKIMMEPNRKNALADLALKEAKLNLTPLQAEKLRTDIAKGKLQSEFQKMENEYIKAGGNKNDGSWYRDLKKNIGRVIELYKSSMNQDADYDELTPLHD